MSAADTAIDPRAIAENIEAVRERIVQACQRAGRDPQEVTLVGVSKTFPVDAIAAAQAAGITDFGENKVQELTAKAEDLPGVVQGGEVRWHMIGHLQRNKAKDVVAMADFFHALDSPRLAKELDKRAGREDRVMPCYLQVNVSDEDSKYGVGPSKAHALLDKIAAYPHVRVLGLMTLAEYTDDPEEVRGQFRMLRRLAEQYDSASNPQVDLRDLSMGMSGDFEVAIEEGATHVRIGSAIFGART